MFYPVDSLKKGGRFYLCWVADSWPERFSAIRSPRIVRYNIRKICDALLVVMKNESGRPRNRFSLRLSSQLLRGLVRIYQRKASIYIDDMYTLSANVLNSTQGLDVQVVTKKPVVPRRSRTKRAQRLVIEVDQANFEEQLQNANNAVARIEDITLKEPALPKDQLLLNDGFGEIHKDQAYQMAIDRSVEMMLADEASAIQQSALGIRLDATVDQSHDKSRLAHEPAHMERISAEHDISVFGKSVVEGPSLLDIDKVIPELPEILPTAPQPEDQAIDIEKPSETTRAEKSPGVQAGKELTKQNGTQEIVLEELEEIGPQPKRRRLNKLKVDKQIQLNSDFIRERIANINVELRCENTPEAIAAPIFAPADILLRRAAHCGPSAATRFSARLDALCARYFLARARLATAPGYRDVEMAMAPVSTRIPEETNTSANRTGPELEVQVESAQPDITAHLEVEVPAVVSYEQNAIEMADLPTQKPKNLRPDYVSKKRRLSDMQEADKENIPAAANLPRLMVEHVPDESYRTPEQDRLSQLLKQVGLADDGRRRTGSGTETPLGSLDRTRVSLGDSEKTTDSTKLILEEWGTEKTMRRIFECVLEGFGPINVNTLMTRGSLRARKKRLAAARCFNSILKLKQHGFIQIIKQPGTNNIENIELGRKVIPEIISC